MAQRTLYLLRHGQEQREYRKTNPEDELQGPLTALGREQAAAAAEFLKTETFSQIVVSTLRRAVETASFQLPFHSETPVVYTDLIREVVPSVPAHLRDYFSYIPADKIAAMQVRMGDAFDTYFQPAPDTHDTLLLVCHGNLIRYFAGRIIGASAEADAWLHMEVYNAALTIVRIGGERHDAVVQLNSACYLSEAQRTFL